MNLATINYHIIEHTDTQGDRSYKFKVVCDAVSETKSVLHREDIKLFKDDYTVIR